MTSNPHNMSRSFDLDQAEETCRGEFIQEGFICRGFEHYFVSKSSHCLEPCLNLSFNQIVGPGKVVSTSLAVSQSVILRLPAFQLGPKIQACAL